MESTVSLSLSHALHSTENKDKSKWKKKKVHGHKLPSLNVRIPNTYIFLLPIFSFGYGINLCKSNSSLESSHPHLLFLSFFSWSSLKFSFFSFWALTISSMAAHIIQNNHEISKQEIQTAIAKAAELRTIHAALLHGNSPASMRFPTSASPSIPLSSNLFSGQDYPVFTPVTMIKFFFPGFSVSA